MLGLVVDPESVREELERRIEVEADDLESLLVEWLTEVNYQHSVEGELYARVVLETVDAAACRATGTVFGEPHDPTRHVQHTELKAVTFHDLYVREEEGGFRAQVIFDV